MTATSALQLAAAALPLSQEESRSIVTDEQLQQLYASWQAVFAHSHAVENFRDRALPPREPASRSEDTAHGPRDAGFKAASGVPDDTSPTNRASRQVGDLRGGEPGFATDRRAAVAGKVGVVDGDGTQLISAQTALRIAPGSAVAQGASRDRQGIADSRAPNAEAYREQAGGHRPSAHDIAAADAAKVIARDSVNVYLHGSEVAIVVRDSRLTEPEAMTCALATAQQLTGERDALQRLTLNGRPIYERPSRSIAATLPDLIFAC